MRTRVTFVALPLLATASLHGHNQARAHGHRLEHRAVVVQVEVITVTQIVTVTVDAEVTTSDAMQSSATFAEPTSSSSVSGVILTSGAAPKKPPTISSQPLAENTEVAGPPKINGNGGNPFKVLDTVPHTAIVQNSCDYPVYLWSVGNESCEGLAIECQRIEANSTYTESIRKCQHGGISLKISMTEDISKPMQFEYTVDQKDTSIVAYDISYLNCMNNGKGEEDLSECAGHDGGIQAIGGGDCRDFHCRANEWCKIQAYVVAEFGFKPGAPVGGCKVDKGLAFELCAGNR